MHSYTTQSHQRNYQGNVVLPSQPHATVAQPKRRKALAGIVTSALALTVAVTSCILGATTLHNQSRPHVHATTVEITQSDTTQNTYNEDRAYDTYYQPAIRTRESHVTGDTQRHEDNRNRDDITDTSTDNDKRDESGPHHKRHHHHKRLHRVPISQTEHETEPMPSLNNNRDN